MRGTLINNILSLTLICGRIITTDCCCYNANVQTVRVLRSVPKNMILPSDLPLACPNAYTLFWIQWRKECSIGGAPRFKFFDTSSRTSISNIWLWGFFTWVFIGGSRWFSRRLPLIEQNPGPSRWWELFWISLYACLSHETWRIRGLSAKMS